MIKCDFCNKVRHYSYGAEVKVFGITFFICNHCAEAKARDYIVDPFTGRKNEAVIHYIETALGKELG